jgi:pimeloyl-ACP methyl ester carboxylesterase
MESKAVPSAVASPDHTIFRVLGIVLRATNAVSSKLASRMLYWLWCHPIRHRPAGREETVKKEAQVTDFELNGVGYKLYGFGKQGPSVLLVHGWDGRGMQMMAFIKPLVDAGFKVFAFDAHGHGESPGQQTNGVIIRDMVAKISSTVGGLYAIVAHSIGGSFSLAALDEIKVQRAVLIAPPQNMQTVYEKVERRLGIPSQAGELFKQLFERDFPGVWERFSIERMVTNLPDVQGLIIHDEEDDFVFVAEGRAVHQAWKGSELHVTTGYGHRKILRSDQVVRRVVEFLGRQRDDDVAAPLEVRRETSPLGNVVG